MGCGCCDAAFIVSGQEFYFDNVENHGEKFPGFRKMDNDIGRELRIDDNIKRNKNTADERAFENCEANE